MKNILSLSIFVFPGLALAQVADSLNMSLLGTVPGSIKSVYVDTSRNLLYAGGAGGVIILDISDRSHPVHLSSIPFEMVLDVHASGNMLVVSAHEQGVALVDVSDPSSPVVLSIYQLPYDNAGIHVAYLYGNTVFFAERYIGLFSLDVSDPYNPVLLDTLEMGTVQSIYVRNDTVFLAGGGSDLKIIDASDPDNLTLVSEHTSGFFSWAIDLAVVGDTVYLADYGEGLRVVDISDPTNPVDVDSLDTPDDARRVALSSGLVYVGMYNDSILVVDRNTLSVESIYYDDTDMEELFAEGNYLYVAAGDYGVSILDASNPSSVVLSSNFDTPDFTTGISVQGNYAYLADWNGGVMVVDISSPRNPRLIASVPVHWPQDLVARDDYLFVANGYDGFYVINISDPANPYLDGNYNTAGFSRNIALRNNYAFVADNYNGVVVLDVSVPPVPSYITTYSIDPAAIEIFLKDTLLFVAAGDSGLYILNVSDVNNPVEVGRYHPDSSGFFENVYVAGNYAFLNDYYALHIVDVSDPASPTLVQTDSLGLFTIEDVWGYRNLVYIAAMDSGLRVMDISDPSFPSMVGYYDPYIIPFRNGMDARDSLVFVSGWMGGFWILKTSIPVGHDERSISAGIAPFQITGAGVILRFSGRFDIYSISGRLIRSGISTGRDRIHLKPGAYILRTEGETYKLLIR